MVGFTKAVQSLFKRWLRSEDGMAAVEAAMVFPILLTLLLGTYDLGNAVLANQKTIRASQVVADLITRNSSVDTAMINDSIDAGELALEPFPTASFGVDIVSISFDDAGAASIDWRETQNMTPLADVLTRVAALSESGDGVLVVATEYDFEPIFAGFLINTISMQEVAFARGRKGATIERN